jgi:hypothetical protein
MFDWLLRALHFCNYHRASAPITHEISNQRLCAELADEKSRAQHLDRRLRAQISMLNETNHRNKHLQVELEIKASRLRNFEQRQDAQTSTMTEVKRQTSILKPSSNIKRAACGILSFDWNKKPRDWRR